MTNDVDEAELERVLGTYTPPTPLTDADLGAALGADAVAPASGAESEVGDLAGARVRDDALDERDARIEELELESERLKKAERDREERAELDRIVRYAKTLGTDASDREIESAILSRYLMDEDFQAAYDGRHEDPLRWEMRVDMLDEMFGPPADYGLAAAVVAAREAIPADRGTGHDYGDFATMSGQEFDTASRQVFADFESGKLKSPTGGSAVFTTDPRRA